MTAKGMNCSRLALVCSVALGAMTPHLALAQSAPAAAPQTKKTQAELQAEAAAAKAAAPQGSEADDAAAIAAIVGETSESKKDIVVTGTSIRGAAPTGTNLLAVTAEEIKAAGATSGSQVLATIPQLGVGYFNTLPQSQGGENTAAGNSAQFVNRVNLRPVGAGADTGSNTLILINGARQSSIGVNQAVGSPDSVPPALLERVEVNTDGGSAIYGSDAISGVINFVTRRRFDGVQIGARYGWAEGGYQTYDGNVIVGKEWGSGSAYASFSYAKQDTLFGFQRPWFKPLDFSTGLRLDLNCNTPNVRVNAVGTTTLHYYAAAGTGVNATSFTVTPTVTGTPNVCSNTQETTIGNGFKRYNGLVSFAQDFSDSVKLTVRGRYASNRQGGFLNPVNYNASISTDNPFFRPLAGADAGLTSYTVLGNFSAAQGREPRKFKNFNEQYGVVAELTADIDGNWQARLSANWDHANSGYDNPGGGTSAQGFEGTGGAGTGVGGLNAALTNPPTATSCRTAVLAVTAAGGRLANTTASNAALAAARLACFDPFTIGASAPALISTIQTQRIIGEGHDTILNFKGVVDGSLFELPGGKVRLAVGFEYLDDHFRKGNGTVNLGGTITLAKVKQRNISGFAELNIPIVSGANAMPLVRELRLALSGRYDHYTRFGSVFNPRVGGTWKPLDWLSIRGTWGKSFRAPTTVDLLGTSFNNFSIITQPLSGAGSSPFFTNAVADPSRPPSTQIVQQAFVLLGSQPDLKPQRGSNWSVGFDLTPVQGLRASINYYYNHLTDNVGNPSAAVPIFPGLAFLADTTPTAQEVAAFRLLAPNVEADYNNYPLTEIYGLFDLRNRNMGSQVTSGIDYSVRYQRAIGSVNAFISASGNIQITNKTSIAPGQPFTSNIRNLTGGTSAAIAPQSLHRMTIQTGLNSKSWSASVTLNHTDGFDIGQTLTILQDHVHAFNVVNFFAQYSFQGDGFLERNLQLTFAINNVFDTPPPKFRTTTGTGNGFSNGSTIGRLFQVGFTKKF